MADFHWYIQTRPKSLICQKENQSGRSLIRLVNSTKFLYRSGPGLFIESLNFMLSGRPLLTRSVQQDRFLILKIWSFFVEFIELIVSCDLNFHFRTLTRRITEIQNQSSKRFIRYNSLPNYRLNYIPVSMTHLLRVIGRHNDEMLLQVNLLVFACLVNQLSNQILLQLKISFASQV